MTRPRQWASALLLLAIGLANVGPALAADSSSAGAWQWPANGRITQPFGCTGAWTNGRVGRCAHFHNGIDIANRQGTPIRAAHAGVVAFVGWNPNDGRDKAWIVIINHGGGLRSWYAHMLPRRINGAGRGDRVAAGDLIGYMGQTGRATGVHLHFGIERHFRFVNPRPYLPGRPAGGARKTDSGASAILPPATSASRAYFHHWPRAYFAY
jgi:murein DD-endopeptidase MepM/ murein hydrolase activator NlpD